MKNYTFKKNFFDFIISLVICFFITAFVYSYTKNILPKHRINPAHILPNVSYSKNTSIHIPVLEYHDLKQRYSYKLNSLEIMPKNFEEDIKALTAKGFHSISFSELEAFKKGKFKLPSKPIIISFDDGYKSNFAYAYPVLKKYKVKAEINIIVKYIGVKKLSKSFLSWNDINLMIKSGLIEFGSHTYGSHSLKLLKQMKTETMKHYYNRILNDLKTSKRIIKQKTGVNTDIFCFPFGYQNPTLKKAVIDAGFKTLLTSERGLVKRNTPIEDIKRIEVYGNENSNKLIAEIQNYINNKYLK